MALTEAQRIPRATYRVQLHGQFKFSDLERRIPYLAALGVSDCYSSPIHLSTPGSTHGYDVADYRRINPELGGEMGFGNLAAKLAERRMGLLVDFVSNHMGISGPFNVWWGNVLECGPYSPYARFFDLHWRAADEAERPRILVPVLEDHYGIVLESGGLQLRYFENTLRVYYGELHFPLNPGAYAGVLGGVFARSDCPAKAQGMLREWADAFQVLVPPGSRPAPNPEIPERFDALKEKLSQALDRDPNLRAMLDSHLEKLNGRKGDPSSFDPLDRILENQHYRLARWKTGIYAINYRRFFAIDTLVGLRMENPEVFNASHGLLALLLRGNKVTGLRIDHIDGLWDPQEYLERLQALKPADPNEKPLYVVVEKILEPGETLPESWPIHGTTGYEFITQCAGLLTRAASEKEFTVIYREFTGEAQSFEDLVYEKKRAILAEMFINTLTQLATNLSRLLAADRLWRDVTPRELMVALREIMANFPVYRTYRRLGRPCGDQDRRTIETACALAVRRNPLLDLEPFNLVRDVVIGAYPPPSASEERRAQLGRWVLGFQQYTGAVMAKSVEDTAFYLYNRLIALNEVGGNPAQFGAPIEAFHATNRERRRQTPHGMIATSTHDNKMSEDVRARLYALSEIPEEWRAWLLEWRDLNRGHKASVDGHDAPDSNEEYRLYQVLLGAWPLGADSTDEAFRERIRTYFRKAVNEAKLNTTWTQPNEAWLAAGDRFIDGILTPTSGRAFLESFIPKANRLAHLGSINSLVQVVLKLTSPGVPDLYQGNETWDFSLVDPDNRRPVDFEMREKLLEEVEEQPPLELLRGWRDGRIKLRVTRDLLHFRRDHANLFRFGDYAPLAIHGRFADHAVCFQRTFEGETILAVTARQTAKIGCPPLGLVWEDTGVAGPRAVQEWRDLFTNRKFNAGADLRLSDLFAELPFAVLCGRGASKT